MKNIKLTKFLALLLVFLGLLSIAGCHQNRIPSDDLEDEPTGDVDCEEYPDHEDCKDDEPEHEHVPCPDCGKCTADDCDGAAEDKCTCDEEPEEEYMFSMGFTVYPLKDSEGNYLDAYSVGDYIGEDTVVNVPSVYDGKPVIKIKDATFAKNEKITKVIIPSSIQMLGNNVFSNCTALQEIEFEENSQLAKIPNNAFYKCTSLKEITIPDSVRVIGDYAFYQCSAINELYISSNVQAIGRSAFGAMTSLSKLSVPFIGAGASDSAEAKVLGYVFDTVHSDFSVQISQKISETSIKTYYLPTSLKIIELVEGGYTYLGYGSLSGLSTVESLILPASFDRLYSEVFSGTTSIGKIYFRGTSAQWLEVVGQHSTGNKEFLANVEIVYDFAG